MNHLWFLLPILLALPAIYFLVTRKPHGGSGGDRADYSTDSHNDQPPADAGQPRGGS
jgi:hypothetical protein